MENLERYGKRFVVGLMVGVCVWALMSSFGLAGLVTFASPNPLINTVYAALFFGAIQTSLAFANDVLDPPKSTSDKPCKSAHVDAGFDRTTALTEQSLIRTISSDRSSKSYVARLNEEASLESPIAQAQR